MNLTASITLGILGGGQLAKMFAQIASTWDIKIHIIDSDAHCSARGVAHDFVQGNIKNTKEVVEFGMNCDVITIDTEHVSTEGLRQLEQAGKPVFPKADVLEIIQDKAKQRAFYEQHHFPGPQNVDLNSKAEILSALTEGKITIPFVQKARTGGYDGKGVHIVRTQADLEGIMDTASTVEDFIEVETEIAVIAARDQKGNTSSFPVVEMEFHPTANLVDKLISPARISSEIREEARALAEQIITAYGHIGILAVEMFVTKSGNILVNEVAPRPHNSGHQTIETLVTSQYEQLLRILLGMPLGSTKVLKPSVMVNLLGEEDQTGNVQYKGVEEALQIEGVKLHLYGKPITKPMRKMGHATIFADTIEEAVEKANQVQKLVKVVSN